MDHDNDRAFFRFVYIVCPIAYVVFRLLPDLIFYVAPCIGSAALCAVLWRKGCHVDKVNYRRVAGLMGGTVVLIIVSVGFPSPAANVPEVAAAVESPLLFIAYNVVKGGIEALINWSWLSYFRGILPGIIPPAHYEYVYYDLRDLSWCLWIGICVGAPILFQRWADKEDAEQMREWSETCYAQVQKAEEDAARTRRRCENEIYSAKCEIAARDEEIAKLKALADLIKTSASTPNPTDQSPAPTGTGVFDSDKL